MKHLKAEQIIEQINERLETPFVSAKFGDLWKEHQKRMLDEGQISIDMIIDIAWKQGRRSLLMEHAIHELYEHKASKFLPNDKEVESWFEDNIGIVNDCSASSAIYKFRLWLKDRYNHHLQW